jgi:hypothetical protein
MRAIYLIRKEDYVMFALYVRAMRWANIRYGRAHMCNVQDEIAEFLECPSVEELCDVLHTIIRLTGSVWMGYVIYPTAKKMALRYSAYGSIRSERNR